jgi:hypothetical protein
MQPQHLKVPPLTLQFCWQKFVQEMLNLEQSNDGLHRMPLTMRPPVTPKAVRQVNRDKMNNSYIHGIIAFAWMTSTFFLSCKDSPGVGIIILTLFLLVNAWFIMAWQRNYALNLTVKVIVMLGLMFSFFLLEGLTIGVFDKFRFHEVVPKYFVISVLLAGQFIASFVAAFFVCPLLCSTFNKYKIEMSIIVGMPSMCFITYINFSSINKSALTIGTFFSKLLGIILAALFVSTIFQRIFMTDKSNNGLVTDAANDAAHHNP